MDEETEKNITDFATDAAKRIMSMKTIHELAKARYEDLLHWLGMPGDTHAEYQPKKLVDIFTKLGKQFGDSITKIEKKNTKESRGALKNLRKTMKKKVTRQDSGERNSITSSLRDKFRKGLH